MYTREVLSALKKKGIEIGDTVSIRVGEKEYSGILLENASKNTDVLELKLNNGYNIGIKYNDGIRLVGKKEGKIPYENEEATKIKGNLSVLMFGGTISSKVEYKTGAVFPAMTAKEFEESFPEARKFCTPMFRNVMSILSEDINTHHWEVMCKEIYNELKEEIPVVATHGTDTMGFSAAAASFAIRNPVKPVVFTGAQRSSDRGSSDNKENFLNSAYYASRGKPGVFVCMHATMNDTTAHVHLGTRVRKMHTSRRDAFKSINSRPFAEVDYSKGMIKYLIENETSKNDMALVNTFNDNVALIYTYPGIKPSFISRLSDYDGVVIAGTGLGHVPSNP
ncbi:MAG: Glu-tRNA(Gln) amidotransferase subunit GatD, partial [Candidatus Micrarchaeia archaeon]